MNMMNDVLGEYLDKFVLVFLDDTLFYLANPQDYADHLRKILGKLREHQLFQKANKCQMWKTSIEFLGQQICRGGLIQTKAKLKAILDWATPGDVKGIRCFLGFLNF